jgi:multimeric flavodoxin WrbA
MNVLAIIGSPKGKGSGYLIVRRIQEHMQHMAQVEFDYLFLKEQDLRNCKGCFTCVTRGEHLCPLKDDREAIEERIEAADGVILVSPCYVSNVSAIMKNFIDRLCYTNHRPRFFGQKLMLVSNAGAGMNKTIEALRLALGTGPTVSAELAYLSPPWPLSERVQAKQERAIAKKTRAFYEAIARDAGRRGLPKRPKFADYLQFRFFKKISADTKEYLRADYAYYSERADYYYDTRIGPLKRLAATVVLKLSMLFMRDLAPRQTTPQQAA